MRICFVKAKKIFGVKTKKNKYRPNLVDNAKSLVAVELTCAKFTSNPGARDKYHPMRGRAQKFLGIPGYLLERVPTQKEEASFMNGLVLALNADGVLCVVVYLPYIIKDGQRIYKSDGSQHEVLIPYDDYVGVWE